MAERPPSVRPAVSPPLWPCAGFEPGQAERLFEAFYTTKAQGLGMGLRISRSIVEAHGGRLWACAHAQGGATLLCALPVGGPSGP